MPAPRKLSPRQMELLLEFAETHRNVALGRSQGPQVSQTVRQAWKALAFKLNSMKEGTTKTADQWRRYWIEFKARTKTKAADSRRNSTSTGGGSNKLVPLNLIEERVLALLGKGAVERSPEVQIPINVPKKETATPTSVIFPFIQLSAPSSPNYHALELKMEVERLLVTPSPLPPSSSVTQDIKTIVAEESQDSETTLSENQPVLQPEIEVSTTEERHSRNYQHPSSSQRRSRRISRPIRRDPNVPHWAYLELRRIAAKDKKNSILEKHLQVEIEKVSEMKQIKLQLRKLNSIMGKISNSLM